MNITFLELKKKCVIDINSGKNLGKVCDLIIDADNGNIIKLIVSPSKCSFLSSNNVELDFNCIVKIGDDSILYKKCPPKKEICVEIPPNCNNPCDNQRNHPLNHPCDFDEE